MPDLRTAKLAETLVNYCTSVRPGDWVLVRSHVAALPLAEQVMEQVAKAGGATREDIGTWFDFLDLDDHVSYGGKA